MKFRFQSFFDVSTSAESMQVIQWSVGGANIIDRCRHLFGAYKYFKLGKISVKFVPASTLPVDPAGLSYAEDDPQTVDPRDQMNPGLVRITNGEDIYTNVSALSEGQQEQVYNAMMLDPRWSKFMLQSGFRRSAYPLYWQIGQLSQDKFPGAVQNVPEMYISHDGQTKTVLATDSFHYLSQKEASSEVHAFTAYTRDTSSSRGLFQVGHRGKLGYLPTDYFQEVAIDGSDENRTVYGANNVPEVSVITCVLPKAHKTKYYYRVFVTEEVYFTGLRSSPMVSANGTQSFGLDQFLYANPIRSFPGSAMVRPGAINDSIRNDGGNLP